jgi:hypothetical protein
MFARSVPKVCSWGPEAHEVAEIYIRFFSMYSKGGYEVAQV